MRGLITILGGSLLSSMALSALFLGETESEGPTEILSEDLASELGLDALMDRYQPAEEDWDSETRSSAPLTGPEALLAELLEQNPSERPTGSRESARAGLRSMEAEFAASMEAAEADMTQESMDDMAGRLGLDRLLRAYEDVLPDQP